MKTLTRFVLIVLLVLAAPALYAGHLKVTITPTQAVSAGAQWRVDGGTWRNSGVTVKNLTNTTHTVDFKAVTGWITPAPFSVTLSGNNTTSSAGTYVQPASLMVNLNVAGQWRIDGGVWRTYSTVATGLAPGNHTLEFGPFGGFTTPPPETIALAAGQAQTLTRNYVAQAYLGATLYPSTGQWRVNGGVWRASGTAAFFDAGTYTVEYAPVVAHVAPPSETVTLAPGAGPRLYRNYTPLTGAITMYLSGDNGFGRWRVDGGAWWTAPLTFNLLEGPHTVEYQAVAGYTAPSTETVNVVVNQITQLNRSYVALPASLSVTLTPASARWRVDGGVWRTSGAVLSVAAGPRVVEYEHLDFHLRPESETVIVAGTTAIARSYTTGAADLLVRSNPPLLGERGVAQWRIDGGPWRRCGERRGIPPGVHALEFQQRPGLSTPDPIAITATAGALLELEADFTMPHRLRFFIKDDLAAGLTLAELQARLSQYAAHFQTIWHRESARRFVFNPATDITVCTADPFSWNYVGSDLPELGFEMWIYARLTDNPTYGSYDGNGGLDLSGAGGATNMKWDRIHDPATLQPDTEPMRQYWTQVSTMIHECQHSFGAGLGEYYSPRFLSDPTSVAPILPTTSYSDAAGGDHFWGSRQEYWGDPLLASCYGQWRLGAPTSLPALLDATRFSPATKGVVNSLCRRSNGWDALPSLLQVKVRVVDATTGQLVPGATCRVWNRRVDGTFNNFEQTVVATATAGEFHFRWEPYPDFSPLNNYDNMKIVKAWAPGYAPAAQWEWIYDAQKARTWELKDSFEITVALSPQP